jgi:hypothetical protein
LIASSLLIAVPARQAPDAGDVCNTGTFEERDALSADKKSAAALVAVGALTSFVAFVVAVAGAARKPQSRVLLNLFAGAAVIETAAGVVVAFLTAMVVC